MLMDRSVIHEEYYMFTVELFLRSDALQQLVHEVLEDAGVDASLY